MSSIHLSLQSNCGDIFDRWNRLCMLLTNRLLWTAFLLSKVSSQVDSSNESVEEVKSTFLPWSFSVLSVKSGVRSRKGRRVLVCLNSRWQLQDFLASSGICSLDSNCYSLSSSMTSMQCTNTKKCLMALCVWAGLAQREACSRDVSLVYLLIIFFAFRRSFLSKMKSF